MKKLLFFLLSCERDLAQTRVTEKKAHSASRTAFSPSTQRDSSTPWWLEIINYNKIPKKSNQPIIVGIIDTGVDPNHPLLKNKLFVFDDNNNLIPATSNFYGYDFTKDSKLILKTPFDDVGHGSHVAGIITELIKQYPDIKIVIYKYYANQKNNNISTLDSTIRAINLAIQHGVHIINYSAGGKDPSPKERAAIELALSRNIIFVSAAGNDGQSIGTNYFYYPGSYGLKNIVQVGNITAEKRLHPTSNFSSQYVHIAAPGDSIRSTLPFSGYGHMTGTSQATPFVTGAMAIAKYFYPQDNYLQLIDKVLKGSSREITLSGRIYNEYLLNLAQL